MPVILERQQDRPASPYLHVDFIGTLYELVLRRVSDLPFNPVVAADFWAGEAGGLTLRGQTLFFHFDDKLAERATRLLIEGPDLLAESPVARAAGKSYREAEQHSQGMSAAISEVANLGEPPSGGSCDQCWDWLDALGAIR